MEKKIVTFSFRYGDNRGFTQWYRYNKEQGLWLDRYDGKMQAVRRPMAEEELAALEELIQKENIPGWNDFCSLDACMCSGDSWALHVTYEDGTGIHAMGHCQYPQGFAQGKKGLEDFFAPYLKG